MAQWERIPFNGRDIYLVTGRISQTVNVCTEKNLRGKYEWTIRLSEGHFVSGGDIRGRATIEDLVDWLKRDKLGRLSRALTGSTSNAQRRSPSSLRPTCPSRLESRLIRLGLNGL